MAALRRCFTDVFGWRNFRAVIFACAEAFWKIRTAHESAVLGKLVNHWSIADGAGEFGRCVSHIRYFLDFILAFNRLRKRAVKIFKRLFVLSFSLGYLVEF